MFKKVSLLLLAFTALATAELKIATINMEKVFDKYHKTQEADNRFKGIREQNKAQFERMITEFKQKQEEGRKLSEDASNIMFTTEVQNQKRQQAEAILSDLRLRDAQIKEFQKQARENLTKQSDASRKDILEEMMSVINALIKEKGYDLALDSSGKTMNRIPTVIYAKAELDLTEDVIKLLNHGQETTQKK